MKKSVQLTVQIGFLILFSFLLISGRVQLWMGLFLLGVAASFFLGRVYCGWICTINTVMQGVTWVKKKLHINSVKTPRFLTRPWVSFTVLALFAGVFIFTAATGRKLPVLPVLFALGVGLTFIFPEELWHRHLCPYGTLMSFPASGARRTMKINPDSCTNCGACLRVCPAKAVEREAKHTIAKKSCLVCLKCSRTCKQGAISYQ